MQRRPFLLACSFLLATACQGNDPASAGNSRTVPLTPRNGGETVDFGNGGAPQCLQNWSPITLSAALDRGLLTEADAARLQGTTVLPFSQVHCPAGGECPEGELTMTTSVAEWLLVEQVKSNGNSIELDPELCPNYVVANLLVELRTAKGELHGAQYLELARHDDGRWYGDSTVDPLYYVGTLPVPQRTEETKLEQVRLHLLTSTAAEAGNEWSLLLDWCRILPSATSGASVMYDYKCIRVAQAGDTPAETRAPAEVEWQPIGLYQGPTEPESYETVVEVYGAEGAQLVLEVLIDGVPRTIEDVVAPSTVSLGKLPVRTAVDVRARLPSDEVSFILSNTAEGGRFHILDTGKCFTDAPCDTIARGVVVPWFPMSTQ